MRIQASRLKYLAFVLGLGACFFDPKATGTGTVTSPQAMDGSVLDGSSGAGSSGSSGSQAGDGVSTGTGGMSGGGAGKAGTAATSGTGGTSPDGGPPPPPLLDNGQACAEDARCTSGHCDGVCCDKGSECCTVVSDCTTQGGLGMSCDDRSMCRGSAGKITCTSEFKCVTVNGARNDMACSNRIEASDCGLYPSVFCLGGELQSGPPPCATSCASDSECDVDAHCSMGKCEADKPNGQQCMRNEDCTASFCKNIVNGTGICCGLVGDCCSTPDDCPDMYRREGMCTDQQTCSGTATVATCIANICSSMMTEANSACVGMPGPACGLYQDVTCMAARSNACRTSCTTMGQCDANAYCDGRQCLAKKPNGGDCANNMECTNGNCNNGVCCGMNQECCKAVADCKLTLDPLCNKDAGRCQGTVRQPTCESAVCRYSATRVDDDRGCMGVGDNCNNAKDIQCDGKPVQNPMCKEVCDTDADCDSGFRCQLDEQSVMRCLQPGGGAAGGGAGRGGGPADSVPSNP
jgi:hypothetical protein